MPKLKIKDWKGLYTNIDPNDMDLEHAETSINWRHGRGKLEFEPRYLSEYELPTIDTALSTGRNWEWETGIYCTLVNDQLAQTPVAAKFDILVVIAKSYDGSTYHRLIYFKDLTNGSGWFEASRYGNLAGTMIENHDGTGNFTNSFFDTDIDAEVFFRVESGHLKIFFPHDAFWLGVLERNINIPGQRVQGPSTFSNKFYLDRLVEAYDSQKNSRWRDLWARIQWGGHERPVAADASNVNYDEVKLTTSPESKIIDMDGSGSGDKCKVWIYEGQFKETGDPLVSVVDYPATEPPTPDTLPNSIWGREYGEYSYPYGMPTMLAIPSGFFDYYQPWDPNTKTVIALDSIGSYNTDTHAIAYTAGGTWAGGYWNLAGRACWQILKTTFEATEWRYIGPNAATGFADTESGYHFIVTAVLDEREECIIHMQNHKFADSGYGSDWVVQVTDTTVKRWSNYRVTRLKYYIRLKSEEVHYLYGETPFLPGEDEIIETSFFLGPNDNTNITLAQNIGIEVEPDEEYRYKVITGFRDIVTESGISIGIDRNDYTSVYYSVLGGGNLQPDLLYTQNVLPVTGANIVNACAVVNTKLAVLSDDTMYIIDVVTDVGALVFTMNRALEFGVKDQFDVAQIQGGVALNTRHGIYTTTGTQSNLISEPIDDVCRDYFSTSRIFYNKDIHELYFKRDGSDNLYRFRFKDQVWEVINKY